MTTPSWRTVEVQIPPEDPRYPDGWWVNTRTGDCVPGSYPAPRPAALEAAQPSPAMAERAARLLLTKRGELPEVHAAWREPLEPFCGNPDGFGPGGYSTHTLRITCRACTDKFGNTEDQLAEWERWAREGVPEYRRIPGAQVVAEARALRGR